MSNCHELVDSNELMILEILALLHIKGILTIHEYTSFYNTWQEINGKNEIIPDGPRRKV